MTDTSPAHSDPQTSNDDMRQQIRNAIDQLERVLPPQAPIRDFVHFNTLEGYQHLPFPQAIRAAREATGRAGYLPESRFREFFRAGRITLDDLDSSMDASESLQCSSAITDRLQQRDIYRIALLHTLKPMTASQLNWLNDERMLSRLQPDVDPALAEKLLADARSHGQMAEADAIHALWQSCLNKLKLAHYLFHPEELLEYDPEKTEDILTELDPEQNTLREPGEAFQLQPHIHQQVHKESRNRLGQLLRQVGHNTTVRGLLKTLTGIDILDDIRPDLQRHMANYLDQGMAGWHSAAREQGFYAAWRHSALEDMAWLFDQMPDWKDAILDLPEDALDTIMLQLRTMGVAESHWISYIESLVLEMPGWSGMFLWRQRRPGYEGNRYPVDLLDYIAVRLVLERLFARRLCRQQWQLEANLDIIRWYFRRRRSEFFVRYNLFNEHLPEYLVTLTQRQLENALIDHTDYQPWKQLADMIITWQQSPLAQPKTGYSVFRHGWQLFCMAQYLGLCAAEIDRLSDDQIAQIFDCIDRFDEDQRSFVWLQAYERNYREQLFNAIANNRGRGRWKQRLQRPEAQLVFCMDDREEGIRRHLEEHNPRIETLGAAGFFGVAINWKGLDDPKPSALCPVVVTPAHELHEVAHTDAQDTLQQHRLRRARRIRLKDMIHQETRHSLFTPLLVAAAAPLSLVALAGKTFFHRSFGQAMERWRDGYDRKVPTQVAITAVDDGSPASPTRPRLGFTDREQADRVQTFLRNIGLQQGFAPLVVMMGHGSISQNNPHMAAYDCGACSGRHGGPNGRAFAAMANRPEIRQLLRERGLEIPQDTWFLGAEHNTCSESITWYDTDAIPEQLQPALEKLKADVYRATQGSAHERCRRLASAPKKPSLNRALKHIIGRAYDFSQARSELGHATHAAAIIGRRAISQGLFLDRRVFLVSYDPDRDPDGKVLESFLALNAQVVSTFFDYYFCTVNTDGYGSGSKVTHNVTGQFGVMDGTSSDLRTGLARQMVEIHEAMRPQVLVEVRTDIISAIYARQPLLQELIGNGWLLLSTIDPDTGQIQLFDPARGFSPWQGQVEPIPEVERSSDWYNGHMHSLPPVLLKQEPGHA